MGFATGSEEIKNYEIEKTESSKDRDTERFDMEDKNVRSYDCAGNVC